MSHANVSAQLSLCAAYASPFKFLFRLTASVLDLKTKFTHCVFLLHITTMTLKKYVYEYIISKIPKEVIYFRFDFGIFINLVHKKFTFNINNRNNLYSYYCFMFNL